MANAYIVGAVRTTNRKKKRQAEPNTLLIWALPWWTNWWIAPGPDRQSG